MTTAAPVKIAKPLYTVKLCVIEFDTTRRDYHVRRSRRNVDSHGPRNGARDRLRAARNTTAYGALLSPSGPSANNRTTRASSFST
jgi:hypothetical protein